MVHKAKTPPGHRARANAHLGGKLKRGVKTIPKRVSIAGKAAGSVTPVPRARPSLKAQIKRSGAGASASIARPKLADTHPAPPSATTSNGNTIELQVAAATAMAERMTLAMSAARAERNTSRSEPESALHGQADQIAIGSPENPDLRIAILLVRPEIRSLSDLSGKNVAIDQKYSASSGDIRVAIVAAGAPVVEVTSGQTAAINRLINHEVPAAVLALVSPDAAEVFPEIAGFRIFQIPLSPRFSNARP